MLVTGSCVSSSFWAVVQFSTQQLPVLCAALCVWDGLSTSLFASGYRLVLNVVHFLFYSHNSAALQPD